MPRRPQQRRSTPPPAARTIVACMADSDRLYTRQFFQVFGAVVLFMSGVALQFHFGQYLQFIGHDIDTLGYVLSASILGTLAIRLHIGRWIDRYGCRPTWLVGTIVVAVAIGLVQFTDRLWLIAVLRTAWAMGTAAVMTTVAVFAARIALPHRRAESIGTIGLAGFIGMIIGPTLGDWIFTGTIDSIAPFRLFFSVGAACSLSAGAIMLLVRMPLNPAAHGFAVADAEPPADAPRPDAPPSTIRVIQKHWPGTVLLAGVVFMMAFCFPSIFLERLAEAHGFKNIKVFFLVYCPVAMTFRVIFRRVPERIGRRRTLLLGLILQAIGLLCLVGVTTQTGLMLPAFLMGTGHCFIFPSMVDLAAGRLPAAHRGIGTSLILGAGDVGMLLGYATLGKLIDGLGFNWALVIIAAIELACAAVFAIRAAAHGRSSSTAADRGTWPIRTERS